MSVRISNLLFIVGLFECFYCWGRPIRLCEGFRFAFPKFCNWWDVKLLGGISFIFLGFCSYFCLMDLKLTLLLSFFLFCLFAYRMARGYEEVSSSKVGRRRGTLGEKPIASSLVAAMSTEELRLYSQVYAEISLEMSDGPAASTVREAHNAIYFTQEQFAVGLHFLVPSLLKQFLHFTRAPLALVHSNVFHILMGCSVLNSLHQLGISLVEICFIYTLKLRIGGRLSMSTHNHRLQFVIGLPNSLKTEAKGIVLVKGSWHVSPGSPKLPFNMN